MGNGRKKVKNPCFRRKCKNDFDIFCHICGKMTARKYRRKLTDRIKKLYLAYFGCAVRDQDKNWAPHVTVWTVLTGSISGVRVESPHCHMLFQWCGENKKIMYVLLFLCHGHPRISPQNQKEDTIPKFAICNLPSSTF